VLASAQIDELIEQATKYAANNGVTYPWVRDVFTDKVIVMGGDADDAPATGGRPLRDPVDGERAASSRSPGRGRSSSRIRASTTTTGHPVTRPGCRPVNRPAQLRRREQTERQQCPYAMCGVGETTHPSLPRSSHP
jgi:hypothetical protein